MVDEDELAHAQPREARAELDADRSSGAGDENGRAGEVLAELPAADVDDRPAEKRLDRYVFRRHTSRSAARSRTPPEGRATRAVASTRRLCALAIARARGCQPIARRTD